MTQRRRQAQNGIPQVFPEPIFLAGGLDLVTPPFQLKPGFCRAAQNFECSIYGGYRRMAGYERFDGQPAPSDGNYTILNATSITGGVVGNTLHGSTSGATGYIAAITATYFVLTATTGVFQAENLNVGAGTIAVSTGAGTVGGASTPKLDAQYKNLAADYYRSLILAVPGSGKILGGFYYNDTNYAFRNNAGGTAAALYKSTTSGWQLVPLGRQLTFKSGNAVVTEGATLTGATSGATGVVTRQALQTGTFAGSNATGIFTFASVTGTFQNNENLQVAAVTIAVANGADSAITLLPGGRFEVDIANFTGSTATKRVYWADGVNKAFEFDGAVAVPITTGMTTDTPLHIKFHLYQLFLSFHGSVQHSAPGFPYQFTIITGASEIALGDDVTGFAVQPSSTTAAALAIFTTGRTAMLYGTDDTNFQLVPQKDEIGAIPYTIQSLSQTVFLDQQGITDLQTTQKFGNFLVGVLSNSVKPLLASLKTTAVASSLSRDLSQYRIFFSNNYAIYMTMVGQKPIGIMPMLFAHTVRCTWNGRKSDGSEVLFFGGDNGFVFQMEKGTSHDGSDIEAYFRLAYNFSRAQTLLKTYRGGRLEISGSGYSEFNFGYSLSYDQTDTIQPDSVLLVSSLSSEAWDGGFSWDSGVWDGVTLAPSSFEIDGTAENISIAIDSTGDYFEPFTVTGGLINYTPRRLLRY